MLPKLQTVNRAAALVAGLVTFVLVAAGQASASLGVVRVSSGYDEPTYVTAGPGSLGLFVVEQPGRIVRLHNGTKTTFLDIRDRVGTDDSEQGLLSMAFDPRFARNHRFFVDYTNRNGDTRVVSFRTNAAGTRAVKSTAHVWLGVDQPYSNHNGGQLQFGPNGLLYISMGDGGSGGDPENRAQNMRSRLGKLLSLNIRKSAPRPRIVALGLRNPWRFSLDRKAGVFWIADVGQGDWEEVDRFVIGNSFLENYGWSRFEGTHLYDAGRHLRHGRRIDPVHEYGHTGGRCSVTGGYMVRGSVPGAGRYFYGDFCSGEVWSFRFANGRRGAVRRHAFTVSSLSSFGLDARGRLLLVSHDGSIFRLVRR